MRKESNGKNTDVECDGKEGMGRGGRCGGLIVAEAGGIWGHLYSSC